MFRSCIRSLQTLRLYKLTSVPSCQRQFGYCVVTRNGIGISGNGTTIFSRTGPTGQRGPPFEVDHSDRKIPTRTEASHWFLDRNFQKFWQNGKQPMCSSSLISWPPCLIKLWFCKETLCCWSPLGLKWLKWGSPSNCTSNLIIKPLKNVQKPSASVQKPRKQQVLHLIFYEVIGPRDEMRV